MVVSARRKRNTLERCNWTCQHCGNTNAEQMQVDHIVPVSRGGSDDPKNLQALCARCNQAKGAALESEIRCGGCNRIAYIQLRTDRGGRCGRCFWSDEAAVAAVAGVSLDGA